VWGEVLSFLPLESACLSAAACRDLLEASLLPTLPCRTHATAFPAILLDRACNPATPLSSSLFAALTLASKPPSRERRVKDFVAGALAFLRRCPQLQSLACPFPSPDLFEAVTWANVTHLDLSQPHSSPLEPFPEVNLSFVAAHSPHITCLLLSRCTVSAVSSLASLASLASLDVAGCGMADVPVKDLFRWVSESGFDSIFEKTQLQELTATGFHVVEKGRRLEADPHMFVCAFERRQSRLAPGGRALRVNCYNGQRPKPLRLSCGRCGERLAGACVSFFLSRPTQAHITFECYFDAPLLEGGVRERAEEAAAGFPPTRAVDCKCGGATRENKFLIAGEGGFVDSFTYKWAAACGPEYVKVELAGEEQGSAARSHDARSLFEG
jgi:hypothetical protein